MVQEAAEPSATGSATGRTERFRRRPFFGAAPGVSPHGSTYAQAGTASVPAGAGFTLKDPQGNKLTNLINENVNLSEQCLESRANTRLVSSQEDAETHPPVSTRKSARDEKTTKSHHVGKRHTKLFVCVPIFSQNHQCQVCGSCTFSLEEDDNEPLHFEGELVCPLDDAEEQSDATGFDEETEARHLRVAIKPTPEEVAAHEETHLPFRSWCRYCVRGRGRSVSHIGRLRIPGNKGFASDRVASPSWTRSTFHGSMGIARAAQRNH